MLNRPSQLLNRISSNPEIFNGKPIIRDMRFKVADILDYLASGMTAEEILTDFPYLEKEDIEAALLYASKKIDHTILSVTLDEA
ncbi:MAG: DUF433 domain-containing protein [Bacteroidota bacterium]|nr:DUF433 domain-containing protein [Bacteroidota bacterium]